MSLNKVELIGYLGADPKIAYTADGKAIANISVATSESWNDKETGKKQTRTEWHHVVMFGKLAEVAKKYLHTGSRVYIEGKQRTRKWTDKKGIDRYATNVIIDMKGTMLMLGENSKKEAPDLVPAEVLAPAAEDYDEDIPFDLLD